MLNKLIAGLIAYAAFCSFAFSAVDLNTANQQQLEAVNGLGAAKAKAIIEYRSKNGAFKSTEDVMKVQGIKQGVYNKVKNEISVGGKPTTTSTPKPPATQAKK